MVDPDGGPAGLYTDDDEPEETPAGRVPLKRVALISASLGHRSAILLAARSSPRLRLSGL